MRRWLLPGISIVLFAIAMCSPTADFVKICGTGVSGETITELMNDGLGVRETLWGWQFFLFGPVGLMVLQPGALGWLANPLGAAALFVRGRSHWIPKGMAVLSLLVAALSLRLTDLFPVPTDDGAACRLAAMGPRLGYWVWLAAIAVAVLSAWMDTSRRREDVAITE